MVSPCRSSKNALQVKYVTVFFLICATESLLATRPPIPIQNCHAFVVVNPAVFRSGCHGLLSLSIAQQRINRRLATATIAMRLRDFVFRRTCSNVSLIHELYLSPIHPTSTSND